jgi:hypothetical protein
MLPGVNGTVLADVPRTIRREGDCFVRWER